MIGTEPNKSRGALSVLAEEEINLLRLPVFQLKFSDLLCIVLVNIYKLLESGLFIGH